MARSWFTRHGFRLRELDKKKVSALVPDLNISIDAASLDTFRQQLASIPGGIEQALLQATEKTRRHMRREIVKGIKERSTLTPAYIGKAVRSKKARLNAGSIYAEIRVAGKGLPLIRYAVNPQTPPPLAGIPVHARVRTTYQLSPGRTHGDRPYTDKYAQSSVSALFTQRMASGHIGSFYRIRGTTSILEQWGARVEFFLYGREVQENLEQVGTTYFTNTLQQQVTHIVGVR